MGRWITQEDWTSVLEANICKDKFSIFILSLSQAIYLLFPHKEDETDRPWIASKIKKWIHKRQSAFFEQGKCRYYTSFVETKSNVSFVLRITNIFIALKSLMCKLILQNGAEK